MRMEFDYIEDMPLIRATITNNDKEVT